ncbi:RNA ligase partner protein [Candidatus Roizmanbacteria bacterium RIFCSPLOWO2_12_FULL_40_12]|uniref:RNA ligase partner protein n=1 Tax=Candidatus Roizmanbacteria bacterium RIFCSPLOWO2_01_FULL_40_42 TaxID=1802066 RepID=A0A1F7J654_9BACT|nr:MAG: RNA ligase partner protein [Candidatus Roizmanbacteria bacterium RIFCSPHIGHO2_01_FULL_40_98]OGK28760.1 MAG: RNA ligase partner protein [Candidatus Roizmanbacteria bacterium RIFCSPHIGHO2_02_FULL_40_53]OGK29618.1 MAG: RNA ligase partner protein [Candidatus Roizmanbacteria bacterium RIFCSPHIGHO2_12_41_18]OGK36347.1 MAG: RNA ligase partner protein [Candidatus Roizmanbacteria bacterium RIFCSPHIGHO2_12_FULL_40_130]OGK51101.1 MAG: RNA ligase partner protein [Candidatus Roizmanbacteria bacteriu
MDKYVLDTNLFFNMAPGLGLGKKTEEVMKKATTAMKTMVKEKKAEFFMPPRVVDELMSFFDDKSQAFLKDFLSVIAVKSPHVSSVEFPAAVFYNLISDIRDRSYKGLTIAEEELKKAAKGLAGSQVKDSKQDFEKAVGAHVKTLRDRYRNATRTGFLDSVADLDLIVLAKEQDAYLVSSDEGVIKWGRIFGIREMDATVFGKKLTDHL